VKGGKDTSNANPAGAPNVPPSAPTPSFELHKEEGKSNQLELTFYIANELGSYIYVGYENAKGEVTYTALTALHPVKYSEA